MAKSLVVAAILLTVLPAFGTCSGSGTSWTCTSGTTPAQVNTVIGSATDGAVVTFASGTYTWTSTMTPDLTKGITFICPSGPCTVTSSGNTAFGFTSGSSSKLYRISGFTFTSAGGLVWTCPAGGCNGTISTFRFDHNTCSGIGASTTVITVGENTAKQYVYGSIDNNTFSSASSFAMTQIIGAADASAPASQQGTGNNLFIEDNTISVTTMSDAGTGAVDGWGPMAGMVFRHNTVTNALVTIHSAETVGGHANGASNWEVYGNTVIATGGSDVPDGYRLIHHQGSFEELFFNNNFTSNTEPMNADALSIAADYPPQYTGAYPTSLQPGRDYHATLMYPVYAWNNRDTANSNKVPAGDEAGEANFAANRDYYDETGKGPQTTSSAPFSGSSGMGFGTLANRPASCTPTPSVLSQDVGRGGVGYFATDVGPQGTGGGTLFGCSATNTWAVRWAEYQYPHPTQGFSVYPTFSPGAGTYGSTQTVTITNPNASGVVCYTVNGATPASNGDGSTCATGTAFTTSSTNVSVSTTQTLKAIAGTSAVSDSQINQQPFTLTGSNPPVVSHGARMSDIIGKGFGP